MRDDSVQLTEVAEAQAETEMQPEAEFQAEEPMEYAEEPSREKPDGEVDPAGEAGWYLEQERLARGLSLEDVGEASGIHPYHIEAIELGDLAYLPERVEALKMVGVYAEVLGFDAEPLVEHYARILPLSPRPAEPRHPANPAPLSSAKILSFGRLPNLPGFKIRQVPGGTRGLIASFVGAMLLFAVASYLLTPGEDEPVMVQAEQADAGPAAAADEGAVDPMPTASTGPDTADVTVEDGAMPEEQATSNRTPEQGEDDTAGTGLDGISSLIEENVSGNGGEVQTIEDPASATDVAVTGEGREFGAGNAESRLTLKAKAPVWVRIEDSQGNVVMTQMLMKGDTYRVPNREGLVVIARDGGLLSYIIDGEEKGILGTPGEILVGRSLDLKSFEG